MENKTSPMPEQQKIGSGFKLMMGMGTLLVVVLVISSVVSVRRIQKSKTVANEARVTIQQQGQEDFTFDSVAVLQIKKEDFAAAPGTDGVQQEYTGVPLWNILENTGLDLTEVTQVILQSRDGSEQILTVEELQLPENVYLVYGIEGKPLGLASEGGDGPFMVLVRQNPHQTPIKQLTLLKLS